MKLENRCLVPADRDTTWGLVMDVPLAASCVPGIDQVSAQDDGKFEAVMRVRVGPISLNLSGTIQLVDQDSDKGEASFVVEASDRRVGGSGSCTVKLSRGASSQPKSKTPGPATLSERAIRIPSPVSSRNRETKSPRPDAKASGRSERMRLATTATPSPPGTSAVKYR